MKSWMRFLGSAPLALGLAILPALASAQSHSQFFDYTGYNAYWNGTAWTSYATGYGNVLGPNTTTGDFTFYTTGSAASAGLTRTLTPVMTVSAAGTVSASAFVGNGSGLTNVVAAPGGTTTQMQYNNNGTMAGSGVYYVSSTGYAGVGTSTPSSRLDVDGSVDIDSFPNVVARFYSGGATGGLYIGSENGNTPFVAAGSGSVGIGIRTAGAERLRIDTSGNVGIGTSSPGTALEVSGTMHVHDSSVAPDNQYNGALRITRAAESGQYINLVRSGNFAWSIGTKYNNNAFAIGNSILSDAGFTSPYFSIATSGNVGIGTTNPDAKLEVSGSVMVDAFNYTGGQKVGYYFRNGFGSSSGYAYNLSIIADQFAAPGRDGGISVNAYDGIRFVTGTNDATGERMRINASGNIGIGTTSPNAPLDVNGTISATNVKAAGTVTYGAYSSAPVACAAGYKGMVAMSNALADLCLCTGSAWVRVGSGGTACSW